MNISTITRLAFRDLLRTPVRSALTALGVMVGVASVGVTTCIGNGAKERIEDALAEPQSRTVFLGAMAPNSIQRRTVTPLASSDALQSADYYAVRKVPRVARASPRIFASSTYVNANGRSIEVVLEGLDVDGFATFSHRLRMGSLFSPRDVQRSVAICLVSETLAQLLGIPDRVLGSTIKINGVPFLVAGIVKDISNPSASASSLSDLHIYAPFSTLRRRINDHSQMIIGAQARDISDVPEVKQRLSDLIEARRMGRKANFIVSAAADSIRYYEEGSKAVARLLAAIGAISLVVGGIGIMNVMLVSISERSWEIGIRIALGMRRRYVLFQFLAEATLLSLAGGAIGIVAGWIVSYCIARAYGWPMELKPAAVGLSFLCSLLVGIVSGSHPAKKAASMMPIDALRSAEC